MPRAKGVPGGKRTPRSVGAYGSKRGTPNKQVKRRQVRQENGRYKAAVEEVKHSQEELDRLAQEAAEGPAEGAKYGSIKELIERVTSPESELVLVPEPEPKPVRKRRATKKAGSSLEGGNPLREGKNWSLGQARQVLRAGYKLDHVVWLTGWGPAWFDDLPLDEDGYGLGTKEWIDSISKDGRGKQAV